MSLSEESRRGRLGAVAHTAVADGRRRRIAALPALVAGNPYQRLLYRALAPYGFTVDGDAVLTAGWLAAARRRVGVLHFHWPHGHYRHTGRGAPVLSWVKLGLFGVRLATARALGYRLVWTVHQVDPHETTSRRLDRVAGRMLARACHALIAHDAWTAGQARRLLGGAVREIAVIPHGSYLGVYREGRDRMEVRRELGIPGRAFVFVALGELRPYKGIDALLAAFGRLDRDDCALVVAGAPRDAAVAALVERAAGGDRRIHPLVGFVPDERVAELYGACDAAVLARHDGGTSGSLILALSLGCPPVAADAPAYRELVGDDRGWLYPPGDADGLLRALRRAASHAEGARLRRERCRAFAATLDWDDIGRRTAPLLAPPEGARP